MEELSRSLDGTSTTAHGSFGEQGPKQSQNVVRSVVPPVQAVLPRAPSNWTVPTKMFLRYCRANVEAVHHWWTGIGWEALSGSGDLRLVSFIQLFLTSGGRPIMKGRFFTKRSGTPSSKKSQPVVKLIGVTGPSLFCCCGRLIS